MEWCTGIQSVFMQVATTSLCIERIPGHFESPEHCGEGSGGPNDWEASTIGACVGLVGLVLVLCFVVWAIQCMKQSLFSLIMSVVLMRDMCRFHVE